MSKAKKIYITLGIVAGIILFGVLFFVVARMIAPQEIPAVSERPVRVERGEPAQVEESESQEEELQEAVSEFAPTAMELCGEEECTEGYVPREIERGMLVEQVRQIVGEHGECRQGVVGSRGGLAAFRGIEGAETPVDGVPTDGICNFQKTVTGDCYGAGYSYTLYLRGGEVLDYSEVVSDGIRNCEEDQIRMQEFIRQFEEEGAS